MPEGHKRSLKGSFQGTLSLGALWNHGPRPASGLSQWQERVVVVPTGFFSMEVKVT